MLDAIKNTSSNVELDRDHIVKRLGLITNLNENINKELDTNLLKIKEFVGEPVEGFEHVYIGKKDEVNRVILILAGLSVPDDRLEKIMQRIEKGLEDLSKTKRSSVLDDAETDAIKELRTTIVNDSAELDLDELFDKY